jgi:ribosomal protein S1
MTSSGNPSPATENSYLSGVTVSFAPPPSPATPPAPAAPAATATPAAAPAAPRPVYTPARDAESAELDQEVAAALGGLSIEQLMEQSAAAKVPMTSGAPAPAGAGAGGPRFDPARPMRGGRPGARRHHEDHINPDNIKRGKITAIRAGNAFVDLGGKSQGICPLEQFDQAPEKDESGEKKGVEVGQEHDFIFKGYDPREGLVILARRGAVQHGAWETLTAGDTVEATVTGVNKGGLELKVGTTRAFMPAGQVDMHFHADLSVFLNQRMSVRVMKVDREDHNILLSRRAVLEEEEVKKAEKTWEELAVGQVREGTVRSVQPYGAFIDVGGVDGLLHVSAMSHQRVADPKKIVKEGDKLQVMVVSVDREKKRVSLSLKQLAKDPWEDVSARFPIGSVAEGTVKAVVDFGAFVELEPGIEGLVHVSQLAMRRVMKPSDVVKAGDKVKAKVQGIDMEKRRISLSMAEAEREAKIASGEIKVEEPKPVSAGAAAAAAGAKPKVPLKPKKQLKGGLF